MSLQDSIDQFLDGAPHAVVGASRDRRKYGNKVLRVYQQNNRPVYAVNPNADEVDGLPAFADLASLPEAVHGVSMITPPRVTESIVQQAIELGIQNMWMQPGAENERSVEIAREAGLNVIPGSACLLVVLGFIDE